MQLTTHHTTTLLYLYISHNTNFWIFYFCSMDNPVGVYLFVKYFIFTYHTYTHFTRRYAERKFISQNFILNAICGNFHLVIFVYFARYKWKRWHRRCTQDQNYILTHAVPSTLKFIVCLCWIQCFTMLFFIFKRINWKLSTKIF